MNQSNQVDEAIYHNGFYIIDHFLNEKHYHQLRASIQNQHENGQLTSAKIGRKTSSLQNELIRRDQIHWLERQTDDTSISAYFSAIDELVKRLNQSLFLGLTTFEAHFSIYKPGSFYKKHVDQFHSNQDRRISCVYYLNENWQIKDGGELDLYDKHDHLITRVIPQGNRFICFQSDLPHEVRTTYQTRYSIAGWLKVRSFTMC